MRSPLGGTVVLGLMTASAAPGQPVAAMSWPLAVDLSVDTGTIPESAALAVRLGPGVHGRPTEDAVREALSDLAGVDRVDLMQDGFAVLHARTDARARARISRIAIVEQLGELGIAVHAVARPRESPLDALRAWSREVGALSRDDVCGLIGAPVVVPAVDLDPLRPAQLRWLAALRSLRDHFVAPAGRGTDPLAADPRLSGLFDAFDAHAALIAAIGSDLPEGPAPHALPDSLEAHFRTPASSRLVQPMPRFGDHGAYHLARVLRAVELHALRRYGEILAAIDEHSGRVGAKTANRADKRRVHERYRALRDAVRSLRSELDAILQHAFPRGR